MNCQAHRYRGEDPRTVTRRWFLKDCGVGMGALALSQLLGSGPLAAAAPVDPLAPKAPPFPARAKRVIYLFMAGAPSHLELFDNKAELAELLPHLATVTDDIAILKAMHTEAFNHAPAQILMNTGSTQFGRPSMGSWVTYGLGSESKDLPAFVVFNTGAHGTSGGSANWG